MTQCKSELQQLQKQLAKHREELDASSDSVARLASEKSSMDAELSKASINTTKLTHALTRVKKDSAEANQRVESIEKVRHCTLP